MSTSPPRAIRLFGTEEPVLKTPTLRAGPLEASLDAGNLRHIKLHGLRHGAGSLVARVSDAVFVQHFLGHAKLATTDESLAAIAYGSGFAHQSHFTRAFKQHTGLTPARYRESTRPVSWRCRDIFL